MKVQEFFGLRAVQPVPYKKEMDCIDPGLIMGVELETEMISPYLDVQSLEKYNFTAERDGSLRGSALEFISMPMQHKHLLSAMTDFFAATKFSDKNYSDRCSVHVHVNCQDVGFEELSNLSLIYPMFEEILLHFVGQYRDTNIYCIPWSHCRNNEKLIAYLWHDPTTAFSSWQKYTALNLLPLTSKGTVEFRHMHGTSDMKKLQMWLGLISSIHSYSRKYSLNDLINQIKTINTESHYEKIFHDVLNGILPYDEAYRAKLYDGVLLAKFSLMGWNEKKEVKVARKKKSAVEILLDEAQEGHPVATQIPRGAIAPTYYNFAPIGAAQPQVDAEQQERVPTRVHYEDIFGRGTTPTTPRLTDMLRNLAPGSVVIFGENDEYYLENGRLRHRAVVRED